MNENSKTFAFVAAAVVLLGLGIWKSIPTPDPDVAGVTLGKEFFPEFTDPLKVASASIVDLDADSDVKHDLKVERVDGQWQINPGKQGYEQVSTDRLADVVKSVIGVKILAVATDNPEKHREFAVVDPTNEAELKTGTEGVGKRITLKDENGKTLVDLILGKADEKNAKIVFVRRPGQDRVYTTELETDRLSPDFGDWAVGDLLQTKDKQLEAVHVDDYGIDKKNVRQAMPGQAGIALMAQRTVLVDKSKADFAKKDGKWAVGKLEVYDQAQGKYVERKIEADEEVETSKLDSLQRALTDLKIVDAVRKPKSLAADLQLDKTFLTNQASPVWQDEQAFDDLQLSGFRLNQKQDKTLEIVSHDGDMIVGFTNGVRYHLRFGDITGKGKAGAAEDGKAGDAKGGAEAKADAPAGGDGAAEGSNTAPNRYLMVQASFDETLVPKPELTKLPEEKPAAEAEKKSEPAAAAKPTEEKKPETTKADDKQPQDKKEEPKKDDAGSCDATDAEVDQLAQAEAPKAAGEPRAAEPKAVEPTKAAEPVKAADPAKALEAPKSTDAPKAADVPKPTDPAKPADAKAATDAKPEDKKPEAKPEEKKPEEPKAEPKVVDPPMTPEERKRIEAENKKKQEQYEADLKAGREKAKELNNQYAAWFYVISDATFREIHLDPTSLVKKKAPAADAAAPGGATAPGQFGLPAGGLLPPGAK
ncbi:MAG: DUF4340 domain-containing protein [Planctomycetales bacterium]|nr:DUF4340 domain-containing protein [Planctomycetales bacterium]MBN8625858.1 DUF4340 domain-containing protein [Planctomycetota bacterium]